LYVSGILKSASERANCPILISGIAGKQIKRKLNYLLLHVEILETRNKYEVTCLKRFDLNNPNLKALAVVGDKKIVDLYRIYSESEFDFKIGKSNIWGYPV
jgi:hypothetical protein